MEIAFQAAAQRCAPRPLASRLSLSALLGLYLATAPTGFAAADPAPAAWVALADACAVSQDVDAIRATALQAGWSEVDLTSPHFDATLTLFADQAVLTNPFIDPAALSAQEVTEKSGIKRGVLMNALVQNMGTGRLGFLTLDLPAGTAFASYRNEGPSDTLQDPPCTVFVNGALPDGVAGTRSTAPPTFTVPDFLVQLSPTS